MEQETQTVNRKQVNKLVNDFWKLHDQALAAGNTESAAGYAAQAFQLLELLPENAVFVSTQH